MFCHMTTIPYLHSPQGKYIYLKEDYFVFKSNDIQFKKKNRCPRSVECSLLVSEQIILRSFRIAVVYFHWTICTILTAALLDLNPDVYLRLSPVTAPSSPLSPPVSPSLPFPETPLSNKSGECTVCFDQEVDTVIYTCGHMCLCHECGLKLKKQINACCPICRRPIKDVIKTYRP